MTRVTGEDEQTKDVLPAPVVPRTPTGAVRWWTAGLTACAALLLCLGAYAGTGAALAAALVLVVLLAWGLPDLVDLPSPRGTTSVLALSGAASAVAVSRTTSEPRLE